MALISFILLIAILFVFAFKRWLLNYIKLLQAYGSIPCPSNRLPLLGNLLNLPLDTYRKKSIISNIFNLFFL